jgi:pimeloyl-ACP methyl ester carboxylesterase
MAFWRGAIGLACALAAAGCAGQGQFLGAENQTFTSLPPTAVVVLYSPAGERELGPEPCAGPLGLVPLGFLSGAGAVPPAIRALAESGGELLVYADCSLARGHRNAAAFETVRPEPCFARGAESATGYGEIKACRRLEDLKRLVQEVKRNLPPERIFVAGSGVGAWAALLAARDPFRKFNAAIAIDPEIAGSAVPGNETWAAAQARHRAWLGPVEALPALVIEATAEDPAAEARAIRAFIDCRLKDPAASCAGAAAGES